MSDSTHSALLPNTREVRAAVEIGRMTVRVLSIPGADPFGSREIVQNIKAQDASLLSRVYAQMQVMNTARTLQGLNAQM